MLWPVYYEMHRRFPDLFLQVEYGMVMDMNGETYGRQSVPQLDDACIVMESDYTPDPQQYQQQQHRGAERNSEPESQFCQSYCG